MLPRCSIFFSQMFSLLAIVFFGMSIFQSACDSSIFILFAFAIFFAVWMVAVTAIFWLRKWKDHLYHYFLHLNLGNAHDKRALFFSRLVLICYQNFLLLQVVSKVYFFSTSLYFFFSFKFSFPFTFLYLLCSWCLFVLFSSLLSEIDERRCQCQVFSHHIAIFCCQRQKSFLLLVIVTVLLRNLW